MVGETPCIGLRAVYNNNNNNINIIYCAFVER